jgi:signal transduction histidine kinase
VARNEWKYVADLVTDLDPDLPMLECFPGEINQVFLNLVVNAAHAIQDVVGSTGDKGTIHIQTRAQEGWIEIRVRDTGAGIPEPIRDKVFLPFFTTKVVGKGTGQGLSIVHSVITKHGGTVQFETGLGLGTTFIVRLPVRANPSPEATL